jgi:alpha-tubulin suppressor-like RCC1 family protein
VTGDGLLCWGSNDYGQLGIGNNADQNSSVAVNLGQGALSMSSY